MLRRVLSYATYSVAGVFFYLSGFMAFASSSFAQLFAFKLAFVAGIAAAGTLLLLVAAALGKFENPRLMIGRTLAWSAGVTAFILFSFTLVYHSDEYKELVSTRPETNPMGDWAFGVPLLLLQGAIAFLMLRKPSATPIT